MTDLPPLSPTTQIRRSADILSAELDGEVILMSVERGSYYSFDAIGSDLWRRLETQTSLAELSDALSRDYNTDTETVSRDLAPLLEELRAEGIIDIAA